MYIKTVDFSLFSSIGIGQRVDLKMIEQEEEIEADDFFVGAANNILLSPTPPPLAKLSKNFDYIVREGESLLVGASVLSGRLLSYAKRHDIGGFEFMAKLPGTVGGMTAMNAGVKEYEIFSLIEELRIGGEWVKASQIEHGYRFSRLPAAVTAVRFFISEGFDHALMERLKAYRKNQPLEPSAGSVFKNPPGDYAGRLIESVGLKGYRKGGMAWSPIHANFLVNLGGGSFDDAIFLIDMAKERVYESFGIKLEEEIKIL